LEDLLLKVFPKEEERIFFLKLLSTGLLGRTLERIIIFEGAGRNGKDTICNDLLRSTLDSYYYYCMPDALMKTSKSGNAN